MSHALLYRLIYYQKIACPSISNNEVAGERPNMNIKVAAHVKA